MLLQINHQDVSNWKQHPVTKHFFNLLKDIETQYSEILKSGTLLEHKNPERQYARIVGFIDCLRTIEDADLVQKKEEIEDEI